MTGAGLFGRAAEWSTLEAIIDHVRERGAALVVRGEAGIGKSALLEAARRHAERDGIEALTTAGVPSESDLAFSGLHQLLLPILPRLEALPGPQRDALSAAFGMTGAPVRDLFLVGLAALNLLADAAERAPLLVMVEDAHWLDRPSGDVLAFVARRVSSEPVALLFAQREGRGGALDGAGLPELRLDGLSDDAAEELLAAQHVRLSARLRRRVITMAAGNPLALTELPSVVHAADGVEGWPTSGPISLTARLERAFADQASALPERTRSLLLVAAADEKVAINELLAAASSLVGSELSADAVDPAEAAGLARLVGTSLTFRHPLVSSAVYQSASATRRRAAHHALAEALRAQPNRRLWHAAAASLGPDESIATELEELAEDLVRRGAISVAASAMERAASLSADAGRQCDRLLRAAELGFELGQVELVQRLVVNAEALGPNAQQRARVTWLREIFTDGSPGDAGRVLSLVSAAGQAQQTGDTELALNLLLGAALRCWWADPGQDARVRVAAGISTIPVPPSDPRLVAIPALAVPIERSADLLDRVAEPDADDHTRDPRSSYLLGMAAHAVYDCERAGRLFDDASAQLRAGGRLGLLAQVLTMRAWDAIPLGELAIAQAAADDGGQLARETGQPVWTAGAQVANALLAAMRGETAASEGLLEEAEKTTIPMGLSSIMCVGLAAHGVAALAAGRPDDALQHLLRMFEPADPAYHMMDRIQGITYLADAALAAGRRDQVDAIMRGLEVTAARAPSPVLHLGLIYARALLADDDAAEPLFETALGSGLRERAFHRARLQLAYGAWLRRKRRTAESRAPLRAARDTFDALGTTPWGERARQELRASGERSRQRVPGARERLTTQELQIAELASTGLSNRDIGQQLFLSPRTVASHLYRLFPKLGITSRAQLHAALSSDAPQSSIQSFR